MRRLNILKKIAKEAGKIVLEGYTQHKDIIHKGVVDLVTDYDIRTEEFLIDALKEEFGEYTIVGEESYTQSSYHHPKAIYIDPIDGTTNFIHGIPHLAISIGLWEDGVPMMGVVYNPILDEMYYASRGDGAYYNDTPISVSSQTSLQQSLVGTGFPYAKVEKGVEYHWVIESITSLLPYIRDIRRLGAASLDLCYLAHGKIDAFYEIDLKPWDVAGAIVVVLEAKGGISNLSDNSYTLGDKGIVATNSHIHSQLLSYLSNIE